MSSSRSLLVFLALISMWATVESYSVGSRTMKDHVEKTNKKGMNLGAFF